MKKLNRKGFTLIELLAVITIMGILMLVAIPAVTRTIENTRRDTFVSTTKSYINAMKNSVAADEIYVFNSPISAAKEGYYYYSFCTDASDDDCKELTNSVSDLMDQGGKSPWGNANVKGYILIHKHQVKEEANNNDNDNDNDNNNNNNNTTTEDDDTGNDGILKMKYEYAIFIIDTGKHGTPKLTSERDLKRSAISTNTGTTVGKLKPGEDNTTDKLDGVELTGVDDTSANRANYNDDTAAEGTCFPVTIG